MLPIKRLLNGLLMFEDPVYLIVTQKLLEAQKMFPKSLQGFKDNDNLQFKTVLVRIISMH